MYKVIYIFINKNKSRNLYWSGLNIDKREEKYIRCLEKQIIKLVRLSFLIVASR